jgi:hypothetical protein
MNEQDVRALVREAIERHLGRPDSATKVAPYGIEQGNRIEPDYRIEPRPDVHEAPDTRRARLQSSYSHPSHILLTVPPGSEVDEGMCVIEPQVRCTHCGFCQSYGH